MSQGHTPDQLDAAWALITRSLSGAIGPQAGITLDRLTEISCLHSRRAVEQLVERRLALLPFCVVADGAGYYRPNDPKHLNRYVHSLRTRHRSLALRESTVVHLAERDGWRRENDRFCSAPAQLDLFSPKD